MPRVHCGNDNVHYVNYDLLPLGFQPNIFFLSPSFKLNRKTNDKLFESHYNVNYANYVLLPLGFQTNILFLLTIFQIESKNK